MKKRKNKSSKFITKSTKKLVYPALVGSLAYHSIDLPDSVSGASNESITAVPDSFFKPHKYKAPEN